jgi:hypothetical protein
MPRYFFDLQDGEFIPDPVGTPLRDTEAARHYAVILIGGLLRDNPSKFWNGDEWRCHVRTEEGLPLFTLTFYATEASAGPRPAPLEPTTPA